MNRLCIILILAVLASVPAMAEQATIFVEGTNVSESQDQVNVTITDVSGKEYFANFTKENVRYSNTYDLYVKEMVEDTVWKVKVDDQNQIDIMISPYRVA